MLVGYHNGSERRRIPRLEILSMCTQESTGSVRRNRTGLDALIYSYDDNHRYLGSA